MEDVFLRIAFAETDEQFESTIGKFDFPKERSNNNSEMLKF